MHRIFLRLGDFEIRWFGVLIAMGFAAAVWLAAKRAPKAGLTAAIAQEICFWVVLGGFAMARILYVVLNWDQFAARPIEALYIQRGGIVFYGGFVGGLLAAWIYARVKRLDFWKIADLLTPSLALAHAFGRLGCFMNGCCYGKSCALPWGVEFPAETVADWGPGAPVGPVHPTQLYEAFFLFYFSFALTIIDRGKKFQGQTLASYGMIYALFRFFVEFWRGDVPRYNHLTVSQWIAIFFFGLCWWWLTRKRTIWARAQGEAIRAEIHRLQAEDSDAGTRRRGDAGKKRKK